MRKNNVKQAFRDLRVRLKEINAEPELSLPARFNATMEAIAEFMVMVQDQANGFKDKFEEIYYRKFEWPEYGALKAFHILLYTLLKERPKGPAEALRAYFLDELAAIGRFFKQHSFLYHYFGSGFTDLDEILFIQGAAVAPALLPEGQSGGELFAQFLAYEQLQDYVLAELKKLDQQNPAGAPVIGGKKWFDWTGEVINLVELGYGIYLSRQVKAGLQEIFDWLEESFGVEIGIPANYFRDIKRRKRLSRTKYTELMQSALIEYMEQDNE